MNHGIHSRSGDVGIHGRRFFGMYLPLAMTAVVIAGIVMICQPATAGDESEVYKLSTDGCSCGGACDAPLNPEKGIGDGNTVSKEECSVDQYGNLKDKLDIPVPETPSKAYCMMKFLKETCGSAGAIVKMYATDFESVPPCWMTSKMYYGNKISSYKFAGFHNGNYSNKSGIFYPGWPNKPPSVYVPSWPITMFEGIDGTTWDFNFYNIWLSEGNEECWELLDKVCWPDGGYVYLIYGPQQETQPSSVDDVKLAWVIDGIFGYAYKIESSQKITLYRTCNNSGSNWWHSSTAYCSYISASSNDKLEECETTLCGADDDFGPEGSVKRVKVTKYDGSTGTAVASHYYYYKRAKTGAAADKVTGIICKSNAAHMVASGGASSYDDWTSISSNFDTYARQKIEYDNDGKVSKITYYKPCESGVCGDVYYEYDSREADSSALEGHWTLDETTGNYEDSSDNGSNYGTVSGSPTRGADGKVDEAVTLDGSDDYISVADNASLNPTDQMSFGGWFKFGTDVLSGADRTLMSKYSSGGYKLYLDGTNDEIRATIHINSADVTVGFSTAMLDESSWFHIFVTYDADKVRIYLNGKEMDSSTGQSGDDITTSTCALLIGAKSGPSEYFKGTIDEVRVYSQALSDMEIRELAFSGLAGRWPCEEGSGTSIKDVSNYLNDGAATGTPSWGDGEKSKYCVELDGSADYILIDCEDTDALDPPSYISFGGWFSFEGEDLTPGSTETLMSKYDSTNTKGYKLELTTDGKIKATVRIDEADKTQEIDTSLEGMAISTWYHIFVTYDGATLKIYLNGVQKDDGESVGARIDVSGSDVDLLIGAQPGTPSNFFNGKVDEIHVYNWALSGDEIADLAAGEVDVIFKEAYNKWYRWRFSSDRTRSGSEGSYTYDGKGSETKIFYNYYGDVVHKQVEEYNSSNTNVRTLHYHYDYDGSGRLVAEYEPSVWAGSFDANSDGTFTYTKETSTGVIHLSEYYLDTGLLAYEKIQNGTSGDKITLAKYEYYDDADIDRDDLLKQITRYAETDQSGAESTWGPEVTAYFYNYDGELDDDLVTGDFYDEEGGYLPKKVYTKTYTDSSCTSYLLNTEERDDNGRMTKLIDTNGVETRYSYNADGTLNYEEVENGDTDLRTEYTYDAYTGKLIRVTNPLDQDTHYVTTTRASATIGGVTYTDLEETRVYPHIESNGDVNGPVHITLAVPGGGQVLSVRTCYLATQSLDGSGLIATPATLTDSNDRTRADTIIDAHGQVTARRIFHKYDSGAVDTSEYLETTYDYYGNGKTKYVIDPKGLYTYYTYDWEQFSGTWYKNDRVYMVTESSGDWTAQGPVQVTWSDDDGQTVRSWAASIDLDDDEPTGTEDLSSSELSRTAYVYDWRGRTTEVWQYHNLPESLGVGTVNTDYYKDEYTAYDNQDRLLRYATAIGEIRATVYDCAGRPVSQWLGTDDTNATRLIPIKMPPNNMRGLSANFYDDSRNGSTGQQRSYVTRAYFIKTLNYAMPPVDEFLEDYFYVDSYYDTAGRMEWTKPSNTPWSKNVYDDLGRVTESYTYQNGSTSVVQTKSTTTYDNGGRVTSTKAYEVTSGSPTANYLETTYAYDEAGRQCKITPPIGGGFTKTAYNAAGQVTASYFCSYEGTTEEDDNVTDDTVITETNYEYDDVGNVILVTGYQRNHDEDSKENALSDSWAATDSQRSYVAKWYDDAHRPVAVVNYGDNGGADLEDYDPAGAGSDYEDGPPARQDNLIVTSYEYDDAGRMDSITDNAGIVTKNYYDALGRTTYVVENYYSDTETYWDDEPCDPKSRTSYPDRCRVTGYTYNAASQVVTQTAIDPNADGDTADNEVTTYTYGGDTGTICPIKRKTLLIKIKYPDGDDTYNNVEFAYYTDGRVKTRTGQAHSGETRMVHFYTYNSYGRLSVDAATTIDASVDGSIRAVVYAYDNYTRPSKITTYDNSACSTDHQVNEVEYTYNGFGQLDLEQQKSDYNTSTHVFDTIYEVDYEYDTIANGARLKYVEYPNGRKVHYVCDGHNGIDDAISRVNKICEDDGAGDPGSSIVEYSYNGAGQVVVKDYPTPDITLDYFGDTPGTYAGFDRFGRIVKQYWYDNDEETPIFDIRHAYDSNSNRTYADRQVYKGHSQYYTYDDLNRLATFNAGKMNSGTTGIESYWNFRGQEWTLDQVGNQTAVKDFGDTNPCFTGEFNAANEYDSTQSDNRKVSTSGKSRMAYDDFYTNSSSNWENPDDPDPESEYEWIGRLRVKAVIGGAALLLLGEDIGPAQVISGLKFSSAPGNGKYAGIVYGYQSTGNYWMLVYENDSGTTRKSLYQVVNGTPTRVKTITATITAGTYYFPYNMANRNAQQTPSLEHDFSYGYPSGRVGVISNMVGVEYSYFSVLNDAVNADTGGRWINNTLSLYLNSNYLHGSSSSDAWYKPILLRNVRLDKFEAIFSFTNTTDSTNYVYFVFNAGDQDSHNYLKIRNSASTQIVPNGYEIVDGCKYASVSSDYSNSSNVPTISQNNKMWVRVRCDNSNVTVWCSDTEGSWSGYCYQTARSNFTDTNGGRIGFAYSGGGYIDDLTITSDGNDDGDFIDAGIDLVEIVENFTTNGNYVEDELAHDACGNLTYDGCYSYTYDAWNRLATVKRAYRDSEGDLQTGSTVATMGYDGLGRRIRKAIDNSADQDCTYRYYYNGQQLIETRNDSYQTLKQHVWGLQYIDELVQIGINENPGEDDDEVTGGTQDYCETYLYAMQDANFNIMGITDDDGVLVERYEYTPYGQRTIYKSAGSDDPLAMSPILESQRVQVSSLDQPYGLCDIGHQGLMHDKEFDLIYNRARMLHPRLGRFIQRDPIGYADGMSLYEYCGSNSISLMDSMGTGIETGANGEKIISAVKAAEIAMDYSNRIDAPVARTVKRILQSKLWKSMVKERKLSSQEELILRRYLWHDMHAIASIFAVAGGFDPGGNVADAPSNRFVYTCEYGFIDMGHYTRSAAAAFALNSERAAYALGVGVEKIQWLSKFVPGLEAWASSAYTPEDLISDKLGAQMGAQWREWTVLLRGPARTKEYFDEMKKEGDSISNLFAVFATYGSYVSFMEGKMVQYEPVDPGNIVDSHGTKAMKYLLKIAAWTNKRHAYQAQFVKSPWHDCVCDKKTNKAIRFSGSPPSLSTMDRRPSMSKETPIHNYMNWDYGLRRDY